MYVAPWKDSVAVLGYTSGAPADSVEPSPENEPNIPRYAYLPFGGGPRVCIGNSFASMEARLMLATMAQKYQLRLKPGQVVELDPLITLRPKNGMHMRVEARAPERVMA